MLHELWAVDIVPTIISALHENKNAGNVRKQDISLEFAAALLYTPLR